MARAIVFNGTTQNAKVTLPNAAPFNSLGAFKFVFKVRDFLPQIGHLFYITNKFEVTYAASGSPPRLDFYDGTNALQVFLAPTNIADIIGKIQFDPANSRWTYEIWKTDGTGRVFTTQSLTDTTNLNFAGKELIFASNEFNTAKAGFKLDWWYMQSGVDALNVFPGAEATSGSTLLKYTFDTDNGDDSSGAGINLTLFGAPTFVDTSGGGGGGSSVTVTETFTAADGTNLAGKVSDSSHTWAQHGSYTGTELINGNKLTKDSSANAALVYANVDLGNDQYAQATLSKLTSLAGSSVSLAICVSSGSDTYYHWRHTNDTNQWRLLKVVSGTSTILGTYDGDIGAARIEKVGSNIKCYVGGVERVSVTDGTISSGNAGIRFAGAASSTTGYAVDGFEAGTFSTGAVPLAPSNLIISAPLSTKTILTWVDNSTNETSFRIERKTGLSGTYSEIASVSANINKYEDTTVSADNTYFYRVRARNATGDSVYCNEAYINTPQNGYNPLRILSWNLQFVTGTDNVHDINRTARWISNINPDLGTFCEVPSIDVTQLVQAVAQITGITWYSHYVGNVPGGGLGNLILSKTPFVSTDAKYLSASRSVAQVKTIINGQVINFFGTHLDATTDDVRLTEINELKPWVATFSEKRIVAGDFNGLGPTGPHITAMTADYFDSWAVSLASGTSQSYPDNPENSNTRTRKNRIDYIFVSKGATTVVNRQSFISDTRDLFNLNVQVLLTTTDDLGVRPSDHNPMYTDFQTPATPTITNISPSEKTEGETGFTLTVNGTGFDTAAVVKLNGVSKTTSFVSSTQLTASISSADIATAGLLPVLVVNSTGEISNSVDLTVNAGGTGPTISNIKVAVNSDTGLAITFRTSVLSHGIVEYGPTSAYGNATIDDTVRYYKEHLKILTGLLPSTTYNFRIKATNSSGVTTTSINFTTATVASGPTVLKLPSALVDTRMPDLSNAVVRTVKTSGGNFTPAQLQNAINEAVAATGVRVIEIDAGLTITGQFTLGNKVDNNWIIIRSSAHGSLAQAKRVTPASVANLFKLITNSVAAPITTATGAHHFRLIGAEVTIDPSAVADAPTGFSQSGLIRFGSTAETSETEWPHHIIIDRCYIHGQPFKNTTRGIYGNGTDYAVIDSYLSEFHNTDADSQAILHGQGRRVKILNCYLEASGENFLCGGVEHTVVPVTTPSDFEFLRNFVVWKEAWKTNHPSYEGINWSSKNHFEFKNGKQVVVFACVFSKWWGSEQTGGSIALKNSDNDKDPTVQVSDFLWYKNHHKNVGNGLIFNGSNWPDEESVDYLRRVTVEDNLWEMNGDVWTDENTGLSSECNVAKIFYSIVTVSTIPQPIYRLQYPDDLKIVHNTFINALAADSYRQINAFSEIPTAEGKLENFVYRDNICGYGLYGIKCGGTEEGILSLNTAANQATYTWTNNMVVGNALNYPPGNIYLPAFSGVKFVNFNSGVGGGDYHLASDSPGKNAASDGRDIGADIDGIALAVLHTEDGDWTAGAANNPPFVNAGANQSLPSGTTQTTVTGTAIDPDNDPLTFLWTRVSGPNVPNIISPTSLSTSITGMVAGTYLFKLSGSDGINPEVTNQVQIVIAPASNVAPSVNAGVDKVLSSTTTNTTLTGTASDPEGQTLSTTWTCIGGPNTPNIASPTSLSTLVSLLIPGVYTFRLTVSDGVNIVSDDIQVLINRLPVVNAGNDQSLSVGTTTVSLTGTASDVDGDTLTFNWSQVSGPSTAVIVSPSAIATNITGLVEGVYVFRLSVSDSINTTVTDDVQITIANNQLPIIDAGVDRNMVSTTTTINLSASGSDPDGGAVSFSWARVSGPSNVSFVTPTSATTTVNGLVPGVYVFRCTVTDNEGTSSFDDITVRINRLPTVNAGVDQTLLSSSTTATLTGSANDADGDTMTFTWSQVSGPNTATINSSNSLSTSVSGLITGTYVFRLSANDGVNSNVTDDVQVVIPAVISTVTVNAGSDRRLPFKVDTTTLAATAVGTITSVNWTRISGPNNPTFSNASSLSTAVSNLIKGSYVFRVSVNGGAAADDVTITVPNKRGTIGGSVSGGGIGGTVTGG